MKANFKENTILNVSQNHSYDTLYGIYIKANLKRNQLQCVPNFRYVTLYNTIPFF